ncbi:hypothetical protein [Erythrobacter sp. F6033]|uniref:hypothetical protein n=1 Tax=Erythrobacter sp. F6033 TaxID=2926401 RepID=UPI001FF545BD|nr:hypothetical protein [Erythrobacter sp. F6033]MCK0128403.1 hypothetical protein [Erythrobacter sp. F6033]
MNTPPLPEWCEAAPEAAFSPPTDCAARADRFERRIKRRNIVEYAAGIIVAIVSGVGAIAFLREGEGLLSIAMALMALGAVTVMWGLYRRGSNLIRRPEDQCLTHLRRQYQRQYDALRSVPRWYLAPLVPGLAMLYAVRLSQSAQQIGWAEAASQAIIPVTTSIAVFAGVALLNWWAAQGLKSKLSSLNSLA